MRKLLENIGKSPELLMGFGIGGMGIAVVLAVEATIKAVHDVQKEEKRKKAKLTKVEVVKTTAKHYIPVAVTAGIATGCLLGSHSASLKKNAAITTAYALSEATLHDYRRKVADKYGEEEEKEIHKEVTESKSKPVNNDTWFNGDSLCYEPNSGGFFHLNSARIKKVLNDTNMQLMKDKAVPLNDFYYELGMPMTDAGKELGWNIRDGLVDISFSSGVREDVPYLIIQYNPKPKPGFDR